MLLVRGVLLVDSIECFNVKLTNCYCSSELGVHTFKLKYVEYVVWERQKRSASCESRHEHLNQAELPTPIVKPGVNYECTISDQSLCTYTTNLPPGQSFYTVIPRV